MSHTEMLYDFSAIESGGPPQRVQHPRHRRHAERYRRGGARCDPMARARTSRLCLLVCVHGVASSLSDPTLRDSLNGAGFVATDGRPLVWWSRMAGFAHADQVCGHDFMGALCAAWWPPAIAIISTAASPKSSRNWRRDCSASTLDWWWPIPSPPFRRLSAEEDEAEVATINDARPDFVWVGLDCRNRKNGCRHVGRVMPRRC